MLDLHDSSVEENEVGALSFVRGRVCFRSEVEACFGLVWSVFVAGAIFYALF